MNREQIYQTLSQIKPDLQGINCTVGGSAALVLQGYTKEAEDIDIVQHTGDRVFLRGIKYEQRMWSAFYDDMNIDLHFSSIDDLKEYQKCFHRIIHALYYIDTTHSYKHAGYFIVTPQGAGLVNWVHHFLDYGYNDARTLMPQGQDKIALTAILGVSAYDKIQWQVEFSQIENQKTSEEFLNFVENWKK